MWYFIEPDFTVDPSVIDDFTTRLQNETDPKTLYICDWPEQIENSIYILYWGQVLDSAHVKEFLQDPAVSSMFHESSRSLTWHRLRVLPLRTCLRLPFLWKRIPLQFPQMTLTKILPMEEMGVYLIVET
jgi:hypothetical protein